MKYLIPIIHPLKVNKKAKYVMVCGCNHRNQVSEVVIKQDDLDSVIERLRELKGKSNE